MAPHNAVCFAAFRCDDCGGISDTMRSCAVSGTDRPFGIKLNGERVVNGGVFVLPAGSAPVVVDYAIALFEARKAPWKMVGMIRPLALLKFALGRLSVADVDPSPGTSSATRPAACAIARRTRVRCGHRRGVSVCVPTRLAHRASACSGSVCKRCGERCSGFRCKRAVSNWPPREPLLAYGRLATIGAVVAAIVQIVVGPWSDARRRHGSRRIEFYVGGAIAGAIALVAFYGASNFLCAHDCVRLRAGRAQPCDRPYQAIIPDVKDAARSLRRRVVVDGCATECRQCGWRCARPTSRMPRCCRACWSQCC